jgi:2-(1,2-epoxy-1,2-dihydrophenyl)acetyl-CoA isomerase
MTDVLLRSLEDGVLTLTMNRPERLNAMNGELLEALHEAATEAAANDEVGVVVLTGAGRAFCAGGDVKSMADGAFRTDTFDTRVRGLRRRMEAARLLHDLPKPTIAALRGAVAGAGLSLALACDLRVGSETIKLTTAFAKVGLSGDFGGTYFLTQLLGTAKARELYLTSPVLGADEAYRLGLLTRVVADADLEAETRKLALTMGRGPRITLSYIKQNMNLAEHASLTDVMDAEALRHTRCAETEDHREAAAAFVEKRQPVFKGR